MADGIYEYVTSTGTVVADTSDIREAVISELIEVWGISEVAARDESTAEGRFVEYITSIRADVGNNNAYIANQINPSLAEAGFFDALFALFGGERDGASQSSVDCTLTGVAGTIVVAGSFARNSVTSTLWYSATEATLDSSGEATVTFFSTDTGEITAEAGEITQIVSGVVGWETITNADDATEGGDEQSLISAKLSRAQQLATNASSTMASVVSNVLNLDNVIAAVGRENRYNVSTVIDGITMPAKSTWLCVDGGAIDDIAEVYAQYTFGTQFYGENETVTGEYTDPISGQYYDDIYIDRPTDVPIKIEVTASLTSSTDLVTQINEAVDDWCDGNIDGFNGCQLGNGISPFEISAALNQYFGASSVYIQKVRITTVSDDSYGYDEIDIELWEKASVSTVEVISA